MTDATDILLGPRDPIQGDLIDGRYRLVRHLQRGGTGTVFLGEHIHVGRAVAVKVLRAALAGEARVAERFAREARIISGLEHPHTVKLFDFGWLDDGRPYLVTEFLEGETLADRLERGPLTVAESVRVTTAVLGALSEAHGQGIVHRDLKPSNVFLQVGSDGDRVRVLDFGIARHGMSTTLTEPGMIMGTPAYMSPEQSLRDDIDGRSDLYSLGAILFECVTGRPPFIAPHPQTLILKHALMPAPRLSDVADGLPGALEAVVARLLEKNPEQRPRDAEHAQAMLQPFLDAELVSSPRHDARTVGADWKPQLSETLEAHLVATAPHSAIVTRRSSRTQRATVVLAALGVLMLGTAAALGFVRALSRPSDVSAAVERPTQPANVPAQPEPLIQPIGAPSPLANEYVGDDLAAAEPEEEPSSPAPTRRPRRRVPPGYIDVEL